MSKEAIKVSLAFTLLIISTYENEIFLVYIVLISAV